MDHSNMHLNHDAQRKHDARRQQVVVRLFDAWLDNDRDRLLSFFREDSVVRGAEGAPHTGLEAIWTVLSARAGADAPQRELVCLHADEQGRVRASWVERYKEDGDIRERRMDGLLAVEGCKVSEWCHAQAG